MAKERFNIHASVVFQLGETLITDEIQALVELVKNCYDADATKVQLLVDTRNSVPDGSAFPNANGFIVIEDNGAGMTIETIRRGWLTISNSIKREIKQRGQLPVDKRTPLGDKGLGRLGAQRLGHNIEIWTRPQEEEVEYHVAFSWRDFSDKELLQDVPVTVEENYQPKRKQGTRIIISDLVTPTFWEGAAATKNLQTELAQMISPYGEVQNFKIAVTVNGETIDLISIAQQVRQTAQVRYRISFDGEVLKIDGKARLEFFRIENKDEHWYELAEADKGEKLFAFLSNRSTLKDYRLRRCNDPGWFIEFFYDQKFIEIAGIVYLNRKIPNPGPFFGEVDSFDLGRSASQQQNVLSTSAEYRQMVKSLSGVRVYRDGFGIRVARDWLGLGKQWTSSPSYYGLKPENVMGYIALSARDNTVLEETTNRQDFVKNAYYDNFYKVLSAWVRFTEHIQSTLRRSWNEYIKEATLPATSDNSPDGLFRALSENLNQARSASKPLKTLRSTLETTVKNARRAVQSAQMGSTLYAIDEGDRRNLEESVKDFEKKASEVDEITKKLDQVVMNLEVLERQSHIIRDQVEELRERIAETYETVSLGITTEALAHEIFNIADRLADQTRWIRAELRKRNIVVAELVTYLERVSNSVSTLRKQLAHLDPSLKYLRESREEIELLPFFKEQEEFFKDRFAKQAIRISIERLDDAPFTIRMNKGKLVQIFDNLLLNSDYWLREEIRLGRLRNGIINIQLDAPFIYIFDNGPGVAIQVENSLFEPFVTMKEHGRGLGLFIIRQLLDTEGCSISLLEKRNISDRKYIFSLNFEAIMVVKDAKK